jgi:hypothetical protein
VKIAVGFQCARGSPDHRRNRTAERRLLHLWLAASAGRCVDHWRQGPRHPSRD